MSGVLPSVARSGREGAPPVAPRLAIAGVLGIVVFGILLLRLWALTVIGGAEYAERAQQNQLRLLRVEAPRGRILDRTGRPLVTNRDARQVVLDLQEVPDARRDQVVHDLARVLETPERELRERVEAAGATPLEPVVMADDVTHDQTVWYLVEHASEFPGVDVRTRYTRTYGLRHTAAHVLGQVGEVSQDQLEGEHADKEPGDRVGQSGIEKSYDEYLRGVDGYDALVVDASGIRQGEGRGLPATPGRNLKLTLDIKLQRTAERAIARAVRAAAATKDGKGSNAGAFAAIEPSTGKVLALGSFPTFDPNMFVTRKRWREVERVYRHPVQPTFNRAIAGTYPPGSIYKPVTAIAAANEGYVKPGDQLSCPPVMEIAKTPFRNWTTEHLGSVDMAASLETSCDTYYYQLAGHFFNDPGSPLQEWSKRFGLGGTTGIDLPGEAAGRIPTPAWRRKHYEREVDKIWKPGHSVNMSIGQGDIEVTPLQMANVYATLANGGTVHTPRIAGSIQDPSGIEQVVLPAGETRTVKVDPAVRAAVHKGLVDVTSGPNGTATAVFDGFPVPVAGKTGTAEKSGQSDLAWFCGYAPADKPTIAACAFVDGGGHGGSSAGPVVLQMFQTWFGVKGGKVTVTEVTE